MKLYRVQTVRDGVKMPWTIHWERTAAHANKTGEEQGPSYVDEVELPKGKDRLIALLNIASANREALAQEFFVKLLKRWPDPGCRSFQTQEAIESTCPKCGVGAGAACRNDQGKVAMTHKERYKE